MPEQIVITAEAAELNELISELQADERIDKADVDYESPEIPGQLGEPITIAILILVGKALAGGAAAETGRRSAGAIWDRVARWHQNHASAKFARRGADGNDQPIDWDEVVTVAAQSQLTSDAPD